MSTVDRAAVTFGRRAHRRHAQSLREQTIDMKNGPQRDAVA